MDELYVCQRYGGEEGIRTLVPYGQTVFKTASLWPLRYLSEFVAFMATVGWKSGTRTHDPAINSRMLYRLSYQPIWCYRRDLNPYEFLQGILNPPCLPIPPR